MNWKELEAQAKTIIPHYTMSELEDKLIEYSWLSAKADEAFNNANEELTIAEDCKKVEFALLVEGQDGKSTAERERKALTSPEWQTVLDSHKELRRARMEAMLKRDQYRRNFDCIRSIMSARKKEMDTFNRGD